MIKKESQLNAQRSKGLQQEKANPRQIDLYANSYALALSSDYMTMFHPLFGDLNKLIKFSETAYEESGMCWKMHESSLDTKERSVLFCNNWLVSCPAL